MQFFLFPNREHDRIRAMKKRFLFIFLIFLAMGLTGCGSSPSNGTSIDPTVTPFNISEPIPSPSPVSATKESCDITAINLDTWKQALPYPEITLFPQIYQGQASLTFWFVNPNLDQAGIEEVDTWAAESAITALKLVSIADDCLFEFENVYTSVVDNGYRLRFSGSIRTADIAQISTSDLDAGGGESGGGQILPVEGDIAGSGQSCQWTQISANLNGLLEDTALSSAFTLIRDTGGTNINAFIQVSQTPDDAAIAQLIETLYAGAGCLQTTLNGISIAITLPDSRLVLTGYQPTMPEGGYDPTALTFARFDAP